MRVSRVFRKLEEVGGLVGFMWGFSPPEPGTIFSPHPTSPHLQMNNPSENLPPTPWSYYFNKLPKQEVAGGMGSLVGSEGGAA